MTQLRRQSVPRVWTRCRERSRTKCDCLRSVHQKLVFISRSEPRTTRNRGSWHKVPGDVLRHPALQTLAVSKQAYVTRCGQLSQCNELCVFIETNTRPGSTSTRRAAALRTDCNRISWLTAQKSQQTGRCSNPACCVWTHGPERVCSIHGEWTTDKIEIAHAGDMDSQRQITINDDCKISDNLRRLDGGAGHDHGICCALLRPKLNELSLLRVETKPIACSPPFNTRNAVCQY